MSKSKTFRRELMVLINKHSKENGSDTPDFILAEYLIECLRVFDKTVKLRTEWYGEKISEEKLRNNKVVGLHEHVFDSDGGSCRVCGQTVIDLLDWKDEKPGYPSRRNAELP